METATIARICAEKSIPILGLRVITDSPAAPFPAPPHILFDIEKQRTDLLHLIGYIIRKPAVIFRLAEFSKQVATARIKLANALMRFYASSSGKVQASNCRTMGHNPPLQICWLEMDEDIGPRHSREADESQPCSGLQIARGNVTGRMRIHAQGNN